MSSKQLARTVLDGKKVTFRVANEEPVTGYLCGMDDFHWMVLTADGEQHLIHKTAPMISLSSVATYADEPGREQMEKIIGPFRRSLTEAGLIPARPVPATPEGLSA